MATGGEVHGRHDGFAKQAFEIVLKSQGEVRTQHSIDAAPQYADVWFVPHNNKRGRRAFMGLLDAGGIIEIYRQTPGTDDIRAEVEKGLTQSRRLSPKRRGAQRVQTWVISPGKPRSALAEMRFEPDTQIIPSGVYQMAPGLCVGLVVISELPVNDATLWLRVFGRGEHQRQALRELFERKDDNPTLTKIWALVMRWRLQVQNTPEEKRDERDEEIVDHLEWWENYQREHHDKAIAEGLAKGLAKGLEQGLERGLEQGIEKGLERGLEKGLEQGLEKGLEKGLEQGHQQGRQQAAVQLIDIVVQDRLDRPLTPEELQGLRKWLAHEDSTAVMRRVMATPVDALPTLLLSAPEA